MGTGFGSAAPTPRPAAAAEEFLAAELAERGLWESRGPLAESAVRGSATWWRAAATPIDDVRGTAAYRRHSLAVLARRTLAWAWQVLPGGAAAMRVTCTVNGSPTAADDVWEGESLLFVLRERLGLPGSKNACEQGECGSCTVYLDGVVVCACLVAAGQAQGRDIRTVEGIGDGGRAGHGAAGVPGRRRGAVRVLHARADRGHRRPAAPGSPARRRGDPRGAGGQPVPLHRLRKDPRRRPAGGGAKARRGGRGGCRVTTVPGTPAPAAPAGLVTRRAPDAGVGASVLRPDGTLKVTGEFAFSSDLWMADMLWGATLRSPHPRARIRSMDITGALKLPGVAAVLTHDDVPGRKTFGLEAADQPVLAGDEIRYQGEPVLIVAADHPETARRAAAAVTVDYEVLTPVTDAEAALRPGAEPVHPDGNLVRHVRIRRGDPQAPADIVVSGRYQVGMQDQAFLGPESGLAVPAEDGGIELYVATQWLHVDQAQIAASLGMPEDKVRLVLAGVGGAFGAREDLSMQIHACLLALHTGRPVKMVYSREESFFGHVHRHPATLYYEHGITPEGRLVSRPRARLSRWRGVHVEFSRGGGERGDTRRRALRGAQRGDRRVRRLHEQPAVRGDARFRRRPGGLRLRVPDGRVRPPAGSWTRSSSASATRCRRAR